MTDPTPARGLLLPEDISEEKRKEIAEELTQRLRNRRENRYGEE
ncbi:MAG: hypothetical protein ABEH90_06375 [Halolamina sp.]